MSDETLAVFTVIEIDGRKPIWCRIGAAWINRDESINVRLNALPINGSLHIRKQDQDDRRQGRQQPQAPYQQPQAPYQGGAPAPAGPRGFRRDGGDK